jgi:uncharacterized protein DUF6152
MKSRIFRSLSPVLVLAGVPVSAHHAFSAEYSADQPITIKGTLTKVEWVNPHGWVYLDVKGPDGKVLNWAVEFGSPNALLRKGLRRSDFPTGVELVVDGYRAKNGSPTINGKTVKFPDGLLGKLAGLFLRFPICGSLR